jgi:hypothetical protein
MHALRAAHLKGLGEELLGLACADAHQENLTLGPQELREAPALLAPLSLLECIIGNGDRLVQLACTTWPESFISSAGWQVSC